MLEIFFLNKQTSNKTLLAMMHEKRKQENVEQLRAQIILPRTIKEFQKFITFFNNCIFIEPKLYGNFMLFMCLFYANKYVTNVYKKSYKLCSRIVFLKVSLKIKKIIKTKIICTGRCRAVLKVVNFWLNQLNVKMFKFMKFFRSLVQLCI